MSYADTANAKLMETCYRQAREIVGNIDGYPTKSDAPPKTALDQAMRRGEGGSMNVIAVAMLAIEIFRAELLSRKSKRKSK